jgi:hypothetical protein
MRILGFPSVSIFVAVFAVPALTQSLPGNAAAKPEFSTKMFPGVQTFSCDDVGGSQIIPSLSQKEMCAQAHKEMSSAMNDFIMQQELACDSIRDYRFDNSKSGVPKLKDYSTCEPVSLFHKRDAVESTR